MNDLPLVAVLPLEMLLVMDSSVDLQTPQRRPLLRNSTEGIGSQRERLGFLPLFLAAAVCLTGAFNDVAGRVRALAFGRFDFVAAILNGVAHSLVFGTAAVRTPELHRQGAVLAASAEMRFVVPRVNGIFCFCVQLALFWTGRLPVANVEFVFPFKRRASPYEVSRGGRFRSLFILASTGLCDALGNAMAFAAQPYVPGESFLFFVFVFVWPVLRGGENDTGTVGRLATQGQCIRCFAKP